MADFPKQWNTSSLLSVPPLEIQYGFHFDLDSLSYAVYTTNFCTVWSQSLQKVEIVEKAKEMGLDDLSDVELRKLLNLLQESTKNPKFTLIDNHLIVSIHAGELEWTFILTTYPLSDFMLKFSKQLLLVSYFQRKKIDALNTLIKHKDMYSKFLTKNFTVSHGSDSINTFKKNNKAIADEFDPFDELKWSKKFDLSFDKEQLSRDDIFQILSQSFDDKQSWKYSNQLLLEKSDTVEVISPLEPTPFSGNFMKIDVNSVPDLKNESAKTPIGTPLNELEDEVNSRQSSSTSPEKSPWSASASPNKNPLSRYTSPDKDQSLSSSPLKNTQSTNNSPKKISPRKNFGSFGTRKKMKRADS